MPADRQHLGVRLDWQLDLNVGGDERKQPKPICFAQNLTPNTFESPPPLVEPPIESVLFPPSAPPTNPPPATDGRTNHGKKRPLDHIPRPPNAFILFRSNFIKHGHVSGQVETNHSSLSKIIGLCWQNVDYQTRLYWQSQAKIALAEHKKKYPEYSFKPSAKDKEATKAAVVTPAPPPAKRRVRESEKPDQKRCEKIADLLVQGKKGAELEKALVAFDRQRAPPPIETRFEAPMTACHFNPASSKPSKRKVSKRERSTSSRPEEIPMAVWKTESPPPQEPASPCPTLDGSQYSFDPMGSSSFDFSNFSFDNSSMDTLPELDGQSAGGLSRSSSYESFDSPPTPVSPYAPLLPPSSLSAQSSFNGSFNGDFEYQQYGSPTSPPYYAASPLDPTHTIAPSAMHVKSPSPLLDAQIDWTRRPTIMVAEQVDQWKREHPGQSVHQMLENVQAAQGNVNNLDFYGAGLELDAFTNPFSPFQPAAPHHDNHLFIGN